MNLLFMSNGLPPYGIPRNGLVSIIDPGRQILTGATGQTAIDYSGHGNTFQLGSAAGADTNDPAWSGNGLLMGTDDYAKSSSPAFDDLAAFTCITVCKPLSAGGDTGGRIIDKNGPSYTGFTLQFNGLSTPNFIRYNTASNTKKYISNIGLTFNANSILSVSASNNLNNDAVKMFINNNKCSISTAVTGIPSIASDANNDLYVGNNTAATKYFDGAIYCQLWYNRVLSDAEYMQAYNGLRRLMSARGVVI